MVPSISDWLDELLAAGVTNVACLISRNPETELASIILRPLGDAIPDTSPRFFAAYGDQLLPLDGVQTFSEAVMRSGMTDAQKLQWLFMTCQEYEMKYPRGLMQEPVDAEQKEA